VSHPSPRGLGIALVVTAVGVVVLFLASTWGVTTWSQARTPSDTGVGALPAVVDNAPASVGTTEQYGPLGSVSMVYAGTHVEDGLLGGVDRPWLGIAARTGSYRAIAAPDLPSPRSGTVAVSEPGDRLAWATGDGVTVYDTGTGDARQLPLDGASRVGAFSPDGSLVTVQASGLAVLDLDGGEVVARARTSDASVPARAAWRPDGSAVDYVAGGALVSVPTDGSRATTQRSPFDPDAELAWSPTGEQLVALTEVADGVLGLVAAPTETDGRLGAAAEVDTSGLAVHELLGFSGDDTVAVSAYLLEPGNIERILDVSLDGGAPVNLTTLPSSGENWQGSATLAASGDALRSGSTDFGAHRWPWSYRARLVACTLVGLFGLGLWLTRRRRSRSHH